MAGFHVGRITAALLIVATLSAGDDQRTLAVLGDKVAAIRRRQIQPLIYHVDENLPVGSFLEDLRAEVRAACDDDCDDDLPSRFALLHERPTAAGLFTVHETTGVLRSSAEVDREEICFRRETVCSVVLEVAVHYAAAGAFDVAVVEVRAANIYVPLNHIRIMLVFTRPSLRGSIKYCNPSVCPSVPYVRFSRN